MNDPRVAQWSPVCAAIAALLAPHAEVVLHDPERDEILAIWNPMSGREPGDPSLLGELDRLTPSPSGVYGPYEKLLADGRRLSSVSAVVTGAEGRPSALLCVNVDRTPLDQAAALLTAFAAPVAERPRALFEQDWTERVAETVGAFVRERRRPLEQLTREDRLAALAELDRLGVFGVRRAVPVVARALRVSRSTVYTLLSDLRSTP
ncbi:transcriptional regulator [Streptosporangium canum]|uniref:helix-turn-helix transcriptional regulator n=1 Tax=Streptosporangium canum TaxID=324952 RepID=UPI00368805B1